MNFVLDNWLLHELIGRFGFFCFMAINLRGEFNTEAILKEELQWFYLIHRWEDKGVQYPPQGF